MSILRSDHVDGGVPATTLSIDHAPVNVLDMAHCRELSLHLANLREEDRARIVIIRGTGRCFSTGVDIDQHTPELMPDLLPAFHEIFHRMLALRAVTVAAVHSYCLGGAAELAFACDRIVAENTARLGFPEITVGCYPPVAIPLMAQRVGPGRAAQMILSGREEAVDVLHAWGLVDRVVAKGELDAGIGEELALYRAKSPDVLGMAAELLHAEARRGWGARIDTLEKAYLDELLVHPDASEGILAFKEKRPAVWKRAVRD